MGMSILFSYWSLGSQDNVRCDLAFMEFMHGHSIPVLWTSYCLLDALES